MALICSEMFPVLHLHLGNVLLELHHLHLAKHELAMKIIPEVLFSHHKLKVLVTAGAHALLQLVDQLIGQIDLGLRHIDIVHALPFQLGTMQEHSVGGSRWLGC